jgi:hypothetical protein
MRHLFAVAITGLLFACAQTSTGASTSAAAATGDRAGAVVKINDSIWAITPVDQPTTRYCFDGALATPALRVDGKKIHFSGTVGEIPPNVRMACTPFTLTAVTAD